MPRVAPERAKLAEAPCAWGWRPAYERRSAGGVLRYFELAKDRSLMNPRWAAPPAAQTCLVSSDASRGRKGGTIIDERVLELSVHEAMMKDPASYRPAECRCGSTRLHLHDRRERRALGSGSAVVTVVIFLCAKCFATWRVLPAFRVLPAEVREDVRRGG